MKHVVSISLGSPARDHAVEIRLLDERFHVERRGTNGDLARAIALYRELDGTVDAFGVGGIEFYLPVANRRYYWRDAKRIRAAVQRSKIGDGNGVRPILARRAVTALERHLREQGHTLRGMTALKTTAVARYFLAQALIDAGCDVVLGDFMFTLGLPLPVKSLAAARALARVLLPAVTQLPYRWLYTLGEEQVRPPSGKWASHYARARIIAGDYLQIREHMPADLCGKIVITNTTTARDVEELRQRGVWLLVTETPRLNGRTFGSNVVEGMLLALLDKPQEDVTPEDFEALIERIPLEPALEVLNAPAVWGETHRDGRSHHRGRGFVNPWPAPPRASVLTQIRYASSRLSRFMLRGGNGLIEVPDVVLAPATPAAADADTVTWVGQSTVLVRHSGRAVLTDPHWSPRAGPWSFGPKRLRPPGLPFDALPPIDVVLISHDHFESSRRAHRAPASGCSSGDVRGAARRRLVAARTRHPDGRRRAGLVAIGTSARAGGHVHTGPALRPAKPVGRQPASVVRLEREGRGAHVAIHRRHRLRPERIPDHRRAARALRLRGDTDRHLRPAGADATQSLRARAGARHRT